MFLFIGLLVSFVGLAYTSDKKPVFPEPEHWRNKAVLPKNVSYYDHLSPRTRSFLDTVKKDVSPELSALCSQEVGNLEKCNEFMHDVVRNYFFSGSAFGARGICETVLEANPYNDRFVIHEKCKNLEPAYKKWQQDWDATQVNQAKKS